MSKNMNGGGRVRDYQRMKNNPWVLPNDTYHQAIWIIRGYYRLMAEADEMITDSPPPPDGQPKSGDVGTPVESKVLKREELMNKAQTIKQCLEVIPVKYRNAIWASIHWGTRYPDDHDRHTYGRYRARYVYEVAKKFKLF